MELQNWTFETLAPGVHVALAARRGLAGCNAGIVDLGAGTLLFDASATLDAARALRAAAETLTGRAPAYLINSHDHPDHTNGNAVFTDEAALIASRTTRDALAEGGLRWLEEFRLEVEERLPAEYVDFFREAYPRPEDFRLPELAFEGRLTFAGKLTAELIELEGHTRSDAVLWIPEERILFAGDLIVAGDLIMIYGDPRAWLQTLDKLAELKPRLIVPGHGPVMEGDAAIAHAREYLTTLLALTAGGGDEAWVQQVPLPEGSAEHWFRDNLRALVRAK